MPRINEIKYCTLVVDGQLMIVPSIESWEVILRQKEVESIRIAYPDMIGSLLDVIHPHRELILAIGLFHEQWFPYVLLRMSDEYQRVHPVQSICSNCNWQGLTANPWLYDVYFGAAHPDACYKKARLRFNIRECPKCGSKLRDAPIWIGVSAE